MTRTNVTISATGFTTVTVQTTKIKENWTNPNLIQILYPRTGDNVASGKQTYIYNLMRLKQIFTITGHLMASDTRTDDQVRDDLRDIINKNETFTLTISGYDGSPYTVAVMKCEFTETPTDEDSGGTLAGASKYQVMIQVLEGEEK